MSEYFSQEDHEEEIEEVIDIDLMTFWEGYKEAVKDIVKSDQGFQFEKYPLLGHLTGGFRPHEFSILCGSTGSGKTQFCANLVAQSVLQNIPTYVASVETGRVDFMKRVLSCLADYDFNDGKSHRSKEIVEKVNTPFNHKIKEANVLLSKFENRVPVETLKEQIENAYNEKKIKLAIVDNMNFFLDVTSAQNVIIEMDRVVHDLIMFCKKVPVHIIMIMHPRKTDSGRITSEYDIKGSSTSVQEAQNVFLFNRPDPKDLGGFDVEETDRELYLAKMRRRGRFVKHKLFFKCVNGVTYHERVLLNHKGESIGIV